MALRGEGTIGGVVERIADISMAAIVLVLLACVIGRYAFGMQAFCVLTGSMYPALAVGDLVVDVPASYASIQTGDIISFVLNEDLEVATHRVVEKHDADHTLTTKGDANVDVDSTPVDARNVIGVVLFSVPQAGIILSFFSTPAGKIAGVALVALIMLIVTLVRMRLRLGCDGVDSVRTERLSHSFKDGGFSDDGGSASAQRDGDALE